MSGSNAFRFSKHETPSAQTAHREHAEWTLIMNQKLIEPEFSWPLDEPVEDVPTTLALATTREIELKRIARRREHDLLGDAEIPADVYWGVHTLRAVENFPITGVPIGHFPELVRALALVKQAAARANRRLGYLAQDKAAAIEKACLLIAEEGRFHDQFVVDAVQGGAGTSTNMNANEVIANVALEVMGRKRGDY